MINLIERECNMIIKPCTPSKELLFFRSLNARLELSQKDHHHYVVLEKGFKGEKNFNLMLRNIQLNVLFLTIYCSKKYDPFSD